MNVDKKVLKKNILYNSIGNFIYLFCQWLLTFLVVRMSGFKDAGILALAMALANILYAFASFGMRGYQVSDSNNQFHEQNYFMSRVVTCTIGMLLLTGFILINHYDAYTKICLIIYMLYKNIEAFIDVIHGSLQKQWRMDIIGKSFIIRSVFMLTSFIAGLSIFKSLLISFLLMVITSILITIFYDYNYYKNIINVNLRKINKTEVKSLLIMCIPLVIYAFLFNNFFAFPKYYLERITNSEILGIYSSVTAPIMVLQAVASFIFNPFINIFSEYFQKGDQKNFNKLTTKIVLSIILLFFVGLLGIMGVGNFALKLLYGKEILQYSYLLYSGLVVVTLMAIMAFFNMLLTVMRKFSSLITINFLGTTLNIILSLIIINKFLIDGVNYVLMITLLFEVILNINVIRDFKKDVFNMQKLKEKILNFSSNHAKFILKYIPSPIVKFIEKKVVGNKNDFKRVTKINKDLPDGINIIGYIKTQTGLGQSARILCNATEKITNKISIIDTKISDALKYNDNEYDGKITNEFKYNISIWDIQPYTNFEIALSDLGKTNLEGRYNVGYWVYELEDIPEKWYPSFNYVNEIWTPSTFSRNAFQKVSPVPVYTIPHGIKVNKNPNLTRKDFNIPEDKFVYLILYDPRSQAERKNPIAAINAYINAFKGKNKNVCLVLKLNGTDEKHINELKTLLKDVDDYVLIDKTLAKEDVYSLISLCDVYVSLHRSEGFGLVMAEAMALGTVCIATNYSGNLEFMNKDNSCLVNYKLVDVDTKNQTVYDEGKWAEADIDDASNYMIKLYEDKSYYNNLKKNAQKKILENFSIDSISKLIDKRIKEIKKNIPKMK